MISRTRLVAAALAGATAGAFACVATAQAQTPSESGKVAAEALFEEGRKLVAAGKFADACPKFADSERLDPSPATLLNLANCWEKSGRSATAWSVYRQAASAANASGRKDLLATAQRRADALAPRLAHLTVNVAQPVEGLDVRFEGFAVDRAEWGVAIPVDTGTHPIEATAPGHKKWTQGVDVPQDGAQVTVAVPALEALPPEAVAAAPPGAPTPSTTSSPAAPSTEPPPSPPDEGSHGNSQRTIGLVVGAVGVVGLGLGGVFALSAKSKYTDSLADCSAADHDLCNPQGITQRDSARSTGNAATVVFGLGAAALVTGGVLWLTAPSHAARTASDKGQDKKTGLAWLAVAPTVGGAVAAGGWQ